MPSFLLSCFGGCASRGVDERRIVSHDAVCLEELTHHRGVGLTEDEQARRSSVESSVAESAGGYDRRKRAAAAIAALAVGMAPELDSEEAADDVVAPCLLPRGCEIWPSCTALIESCQARGLTGVVWKYYSAESPQGKRAGRGEAHTTFSALAH